MWWVLGTICAVVGVAGVLVLGNKRQQRRAVRGLTRRVKKRIATPPRTTASRSAAPPSGFVKAPDPKVLQRCTASGCYMSKSSKKDCRCPCKGELHGTGRPGRKKEVACAPVAASPSASTQPVSTRPGSGPRAAEVTASRIETALRSHVQASSRCNGGTVARRTFGDGRVTYTCNTCKEVLAS